MALRNAGMPPMMSSFFQSLRVHSPEATGSRKWIQWAGLLWMLASPAYSQSWEFSFDPSGNLSAQSLEIPAPPQILAQPQTQVAKPAELASFFVVVADTRALEPCAAAVGAFT